MGGYLGYEVSDLGRVRSLDRFITRARNGVPYQAWVKGCILQPGRCRGYLSVHLGVKRLSIHRLVAYAFLPLVHGKANVNHKNADPGDNRVSNLEWVTQSENVRHAFALGRGRVGERHPRTKITEEAVREVRSRAEAGECREALSRAFGIPKGTLQNILTRATWKYV